MARCSSSRSELRSGARASTGLLLGELLSDDHDIATAAVPWGACLQSPRLLLNSRRSPLGSNVPSLIAAFHDLYHR